MEQTYLDAVSKDKLPVAAVMSVFSLETFLGLFSSDQHQIKSHAEGWVIQRSMSGGNVCVPLDPRKALPGIESSINDPLLSDVLYRFWSHNPPQALQGPVGNTLHQFS